MSNALIVLHAPPDTPDCRALTALRLAGAMLADSKDVHLFLVEDGARLADPKLGADTPAARCFTSCWMSVSMCKCVAAL